MKNKIHIDGNNYGDYLILEKKKNNMVYIEVGHCCVVYLRAEMPTEILTATLANTLIGDTKDWKLPWDEDYNNSLKKKVKKFDFWGKEK